MVSPEFNATVKSRNVLRARIMLKDSLIVDPTFSQFNEMLVYAKQALPNLLVPYDGEVLENDRTKWNTDLMNTELVEIVNNFSDVRIEHLKKVISVVLAENIKKATFSGSTTISQQKEFSSGTTQFRNNSSRYSSQPDIEQQKMIIRKQSLSQITNSSKKIEGVMNTIQKRGNWMLSDIQELEHAANQILYAARNYKNNR